MNQKELLFKDECYKIIGCAMAVHQELGPGFLEHVYHEALALELGARCIRHQREKIIKIYYKGVLLEKRYMADFVCDDAIIIELKALESLRNEHYAQMFNYLKATEMRLGLLINFGGKSLEYKRVIK